MGTPESTQLIALIAKSALFSSIPESRIAELLPDITHLELPRGVMLFHQGSPSDSVYVLLKGSLVAYFLTTKGESKIVGKIEQFETIGELGALSTEPRSLTVKAESDAELIEISSELFRSICKEFPTTLFNIVRPLVTRSLNTIKLLQTEKKPEHIIIFAADKHLDLTQFKQTIATSIENAPNSKLTISSVEIGFFDPNEEKNEESIYINFVDESYDPYFLQKTSEKANNFYLVADGTKPVAVDEFATRMLGVAALDPAVKLNLILLYPENMNGLPAYTPGWLKKYTFNFHHHVRNNSNVDYQRLFRFLNGTPVAVVLSGGGAKGLAHLGVIQALLERGIPIDIIAGTSIGGLVAGCYAWAQTYQETQEGFLWMLHKCYNALSLRKLIWPIVSLFSSDPITSAAKYFFGSQSIENLWQPFFCISSNLSTRREVIHRTGLIWQALRASASTPGIVPPVVIDGDIHFDGGLLNNLPVDVMRNLLGPNSIIIASKLSTTERDKKRYYFPPTLTLMETILYKLHLGYRYYRFPSYLDMFMNSLLLGASQKEEDNAYAANILINPNVSKFKSITRAHKQENVVIKIGYEEATKIFELHSKLDFY